MELKILSFIFIFFCNFSYSKTFYVNAEKGSDTNSGLHKTEAWKSFSNFSRIKLEPGDTINLAAGIEIKGSLILKNIYGDSEKPIVIRSYKDGRAKSKKAIINAADFNNGILIENSSHIRISNLEIRANGGRKSIQNTGKGMRCGILVRTSGDIISENIEISDVDISDIFYENLGYKRPESEVYSANGTQGYGYGIRFINTSEKALIRDVKVLNSSISNVGHTGLKFTSRRNGGIRDFKVFNNIVFNTGGPGIQIGSANNGHVYKNKIDRSGSGNDPRKWGRGSGLWTWGCTGILIEKNQFLNARGPGDSAGIHIDFNCRDVVVQYNLSRNNAGGFCEILGNNYNCSYRYNVSINDGYRIKGKNGAFQEGKTFWLSGFNGKDRKRKGPFNTYFYNNTIYLKKGIEAKIAIDKASNGILIANNIFYIEGPSSLVKGDQYRPEKTGGKFTGDIIFKRNLFLKPENWPSEIQIRDTQPIYGTPAFKNKNGENIEDFVPTNTALIRNKGISIPKLLNDPDGLKYGMKVKVDILGNEIKSQPDLGAIEINN
ncbi:right-handed parallel beta-helix repeat-containing protein [Christiangramia crocea]|uniref:Right-handed parallel beta-helix repeat-containing protein n=1 Tax=Christiangramia crocea TaxID=2904124 RepID=A0A9X1UYE1_9FLAO|nr:right-handed parallel beta-helix repeat-containing protein [Gramella crocea]MCG9972548.1 right-handed parallel beta-helix repeat-containing protein [Gramella crocea]